MKRIALLPLFAAALWGAPLTIDDFTSPVSSITGCQNAGAGIFSAPATNTISGDRNTGLWSGCATVSVTGSSLDITPSPSTTVLVIWNIPAILISLASYTDLVLDVNSNIPALIHFTFNPVDSPACIEGYCFDLITSPGANTYQIPLSSFTGSAICSICPPWEVTYVTMSVTATDPLSTSGLTASANPFVSISNIHLTPEPSAILLTTTGLALLAAKLRRR